MNAVLSLLLLLGLVLLACLGFLPKLVKRIAEPPALPAPGAWRPPQPEPVSFREGMRVCILKGPHRGDFGTVGASAWDEATRHYDRWIAVDGFEDEVLIPVGDLRPLSDSEFIIECLEDRPDLTDAQIRSLLLAKLDVRKRPTYRAAVPAIPLGPRVPTEGRLELPDELAGRL